MLVIETEQSDHTSDSASAETSLSNKAPQHRPISTMSGTTEKSAMAPEHKDTSMAGTVDEDSSTPGPNVTDRGSPLMTPEEHNEGLADVPETAVKGLDLDAVFLNSQETPETQPGNRNSLAPAQSEGSLVPKKEPGLNAAFTKSLDSVAVPAVSRNVPREHRLQSRTLSVVSLLSSRGKSRLRLDRNQKFTLFCLCLVNFTSYLSYSVIAPFYPQEVRLGRRSAPLRSLSRLQDVQCRASFWY